MFSFQRFPLMPHAFWKHKASGEIPCILPFSNFCGFGYKLILQQCRIQTTLWKVFLPVLILPASFPVWHSLCLHFPKPNGVCPHLLCPALPDGKFLLLFTTSASSLVISSSWLANPAVCKLFHKVEFILL